MAESLNQFLSKLGIGQPQVENSPLDLSRLTQMAPAAPVAPVRPKAAPAMAAPTAVQVPQVPEEDELKLDETTPSVSDMDLEDEIQMAATDSGIDLSKPEQTDVLSPQSILETYRRLKPAQEKYEGDLRNLAMLQGGNQIAQAIASGYGGKIGAGEQGIAALREAAREPLSGIERDLTTAKNTMAVSKAAMEYGEAEKMNDPASDISKFYRENAYVLLKKLNPEKDFSGQLENMSATQLQKIPGMKNLGQTLLPQSPWIATDRVDRFGNPIRFNKQTGEYSTADGRAIKPGDYTARDILRKDQLTGQYGIGNVGEGMRVLPTNYGQGIKPQGQTPEGKPKEFTYAEIAKAAPKQAEEFRKMQTEFNKDMKDSREVATSVTNLASKLKVGKNEAVDSGLLGGIQTQAAKMAGQKGVLTDQDLVKFAGAGGVAAKLERVADMLQGEMSESDIKFFKRFAELMGKSLNEDIINRSQLYTEQARQMLDTTAPGITSENVSKLLGVDKVAPIVQNKEKSTSNMVRMKLPNGNLVDIPKENVEKAKARGAVEVQ